MNSARATFASPPCSSIQSAQINRGASSSGASRMAAIKAARREDMGLGPFEVGAACRAAPVRSKSGLARRTYFILLPPATLRQKVRGLLLLPHRFLQRRSTPLTSVSLID